MSFMLKILAGAMKFRCSLALNRSFSDVAIVVMSMRKDSEARLRFEDVDVSRTAEEGLSRCRLSQVDEGEKVSTSAEAMTAELCASTNVLDMASGREVEAKGRREGQYHRRHKSLRIWTCSTKWAISAYNVSLQA